MRKRIYQLMAILMAFAMILCNNSIISLAEEIVPETEEGVYEEVLEETTVDVEELGENEESIEDEVIEEDCLRVTKESLSNPIIENSISTWDCIYFGNFYRTDKDKDGDFSDEQKEPIKWRVLKVEGNNALLMSDSILYGAYGYSEYNNWLNGIPYKDEYYHYYDMSEGGFLNSAFSKDEQDSILFTNVDQEFNEVTSDALNGVKVFLLSKSEVTNEEYGFVGSASRLPYITEYSKWNVDYYNNTADWYLRTKIGDNAFYTVNCYGFLEQMSDGMDGYGGSGLCPAINIDLSKENWEYAGTVSTDDLPDSYSAFSFVSQQIEGTTTCRIIGIYGIWPYSMSIPEEINGLSVVEIASSSFINDEIYGFIYLPNSIKKIDHYAFSDQRYMTLMNIPSQLEYLGTWAFFGVRFFPYELDIPSKCNFIGWSALPDLSDVSVIKVLPGVETIEDFEMFEIYTTCDIYLPDSIKTINDEGYDLDYFTWLTFHCPKGSYIYKWISKRGGNVVDWKNSHENDSYLERQVSIEARQSYWVLQYGQLYSGSSYVRNGAKLKNGVYELAYCEGNDDDDRIWFGSWKFDEKGLIMTGVYDGVYYNESTTNGFPYGISMDEDLANMINNQKPSDVFASYSQIMKYTNDLSESVKLASSVTNFSDEFKALMDASTYRTVQFWKNGNYVSLNEMIDITADNYMNDPKKCRKMLKKLVEERFDTNSEFNKFLKDTSKDAKTVSTYVKAIDKPLKDALSETLKADKAEYKKQAKAGKINTKKFPKDYQKILKESSDSDFLSGAYIIEQVLSTYKYATSDMNDYMSLFKDYTEIINFLEIIKSNAPKNGPLYKAASDLINEYQNQYMTYWAKHFVEGLNQTNGWAKVLSGSKWFSTPIPDITGYIEEDFEDYMFTLLETVTGTQFGTAQKILDFVEDNSDALKSTESLITSVGMRTDAFSALRNVESKIVSNGLTPELLEEYIDTFDMVKLLTSNQYKDMATYYGSHATDSFLFDAAKKNYVSFLNAENDKILSMGYASYNIPADTNPVMYVDFGDKRYYIDGNISDSSQSQFGGGGGIRITDGNKWEHLRLYMYTDYAKNCWGLIEGDRYYFDKDTYAVKGKVLVPITVGNKSVAKTFYFSEGDGTCPADSYTFGALRTGLLTLDDGYTYYFDPYTGEMLTNTTMELKDEVLNVMVPWEFDSKGHGTKLSTYDRMRQGNVGKKPYEVRQIINCPVDVAVYDESGLIVASIINDRVVKAGNENVNVFIDEDGQKIVETYNNIQYKTKITATGSGTCNYSIVGCDENGDFAQKIEYDAITISNGKVINASKENLYTEDDEFILSLYDVNVGETIIPTSINSTNELCKLNINYGDVEEDGYVDRGSFIKLKTSDTMNNDLFIGWYDGDDNLLSEEESFRLQVKEDMSVTAKYIEPTDGIWVFMRKTYPYTGSAVKPQIRVYNKSKLLTAGTDYSVSYKNNVNAYQVADINTPSVMDTKKAPSVTVKGKGLYKDTQTVYFSITPLDLNNADIEESTIVVKETGKKLHPVPTITYNGKKLKENKDFTVEYLDSNSTVVAANNLKQAGEYTVSINGAGNYSGTVANPISLIIVGKQDKENKILSNSAIKISGKIPSIEYTGEEVSVESFFESGEVTLKDGKELLAYGKDYVISRYANNREVGTATVYLKGLGVKNDKTNLAYYGEKKVTFKIVSAYKMNQVTIGNLNKSYVFTGEEIEPSFTVTYKTGKGASAQVETLSEYEDYLVSFTGNVNVGTASILLTGRGKYSGSKKITFKIIPMDITSDVCNAYISDSLKEGKVPFAKGGSKPKVVAELANGTVLNENSDYTLAYANNKKLCSDINSSKAPTVTVKGKGNYKGKKSIKFMIGNSELSQCRIEIPDKLYSEKAGAFMSVPKLYDLDGKLLKAGTDYSKEFKYSLDSNFENVLNKEDTLTFVDGQVSRTIYVLVSGINNYADSTLVSTYRVTAKDLSKANISFTYDDPSGKKNYVYTGEEITPGTGLYVGQMKVTLTTGSGKNKETVTLSADDYSIVGYENNVKCGKATVTIKGQGAYGNTKTATFNIGSKSIKGLSLEKIMSRLLKLFESRQ